jgi:hypothetical protein
LEELPDKLGGPNILQALMKATTYNRGLKSPVQQFFGDTLKITSALALSSQAESGHKGNEDSIFALHVISGISKNET